MQRLVEQIFGGGTAVPPFARGSRRSVAGFWMRSPLPRRLLFF